MGDLITKTINVYEEDLLFLQGRSINLSKLIRTLLHEYVEKESENFWIIHPKFEDFKLPFTIFGDWTKNLGAPENYEKDIPPNTGRPVRLFFPEENDKKAIKKERERQNKLKKERKENPIRDVLEKNEAGGRQREINLNMKLKLSVISREEAKEQISTNESMMNFYAYVLHSKKEDSKNLFNGSNLILGQNTANVMSIFKQSGKNAPRGQYFSFYCTIQFHYGLVDISSH